MRQLLILLVLVVISIPLWPGVNCARPISQHRQEHSESPLALSIYLSKLESCTDESVRLWLRLRYTNTGSKPGGLAQRTSDDPNEAPLELRLSIAKEDLCEDSRARLWLNLHYINRGSKPIILLRKGGSFAGFGISTSIKKAEKGDYISMQNFFSLGVQQPYPTHGAIPPEDRFVILGPGQSHEVNMLDVGIPLMVDKENTRRLRQKEYALRVGMNPWNESPVLAEELSSAWKKYGVLWWKGVMSQPLLLKLTTTTPVKCF